MKELYNKLKNKKIYKYLSRFGLLHGIKIFFKVRRSKVDVVSFKIPGLDYPITLRRNMSDFIVFEEIFMDEIYKINSEKPINTAIDVGANTGLASLYFLYKYNPKLLICIEPHEDNFAILYQNLSKYQNVILYKKALWDKNSYLRFKSNDAESWAFEVIEALKEDEGTISAISLNEIIKDQQLRYIDLLKIDIEGSEKEVFESNNSWIKIVHYLIVETHENIRRGSEKAVFNLVNGNMILQNHIQNNYLFEKANVAYTSAITT